MIRLLTIPEYGDALAFLYREDSRTTLLFQLLRDLGGNAGERHGDWDCLATSGGKDLTGVILIHKPAGWWLVHGKEAAWSYLPNTEELRGYKLKRLQGEKAPVELLLRRRPVAEQLPDRWFDEIFLEIGPRDLLVEPDPDSRLARPEDVPRLEQHDHLYFLERGVGGRTDWRRLVATGHVFVRERDGRLAASLKQYAENDRRCEFGGLFTRPEYRGQGLAAGLIAAYCQVVFQKGKHACLYADDDNTPALRVYNKTGFRRTGTIKIVYFR